jgi:ABC-type multidrug transport system permease subunit
MFISTSVTLGLCIAGSAVCIPLCIIPLTPCTFSNLHKCFFHLFDILRESACSSPCSSFTKLVLGCCPFVNSLCFYTSLIFSFCCLSLFILPFKCSLLLFLKFILFSLLMLFCLPRLTRLGSCSHCS